MSRATLSEAVIKDMEELRKGNEALRSMIKVYQVMAWRLEPFSPMMPYGSHLWLSNIWQGAISLELYLQGYLNYSDLRKEQDRIFLLLHFNDIEK